MISDGLFEDLNSLLRKNIYFEKTPYNELTRLNDVLPDYLSLKNSIYIYKETNLLFNNEKVSNKCKFAANTFCNLTLITILIILMLQLQFTLAANRSQTNHKDILKQQYLNSSSPLSIWKSSLEKHKPVTLLDNVLTDQFVIEIRGSPEMAKIG